MSLLLIEGSISNGISDKLPVPCVQRFFTGFGRSLLAVAEVQGFNAEVVRKLLNDVDGRNFTI